MRVDREVKEKKIKSPSWQIASQANIHLKHSFSKFFKKNHGIRQNTLIIYRVRNDLTLFDRRSLNYKQHTKSEYVALK